MVEARALEFGFELGEAALEFPLGGGLLAAAEELAACGGWTGAAQGLAFAGADRCAKVIRLYPEVRAGEEIVLHAGTRQLLEVAVGEAVVDGSADIFMREVDTADAF